MPKKRSKTDLKDSHFLSLRAFCIMRIILLLCLLVSIVYSKENDYFDDIIKTVNEKQTTWKAGPNHVTALGRHSHRLTRAQFPHEGSTSLPLKPKLVRDKIPKHFDSRTQWSNCQSIWSIKDQGSCGTCWAVSTSSVMSDRLCIASSGQVQVNISAEALAACCADCGLGCNGGYPDKAWPYFLNHGLVTGGDYNSGEGCQPYEVPPTGSSEHKDDIYLVCSPKKCTNKKYKTAYKKDLHFGKTSYLLANDVASIQSEIMTNGPVVAGFTVYDDFMSYTGGVYQHVTGGLAGGHAVRILGWGVDNGTDYWLVANSWNRSWGENGYFRILRGHNECGIEEFMTAGLVQPH